MGKPSRFKNPIYILGARIDVDYCAANFENSDIENMLGVDIDKTLMTEGRVSRPVRAGVKLDSFATASGISEEPGVKVPNCVYYESKVRLNVGHDEDIMEYYIRDIDDIISNIVVTGVSSAALHVGIWRIPGKKSEVFRGSQAVPCFVFGSFVPMFMLQYFDIKLEYTVSPGELQPAPLLTYTGILISDTIRRKVWSSRQKTLQLYINDTSVPVENFAYKSGGKQRKDL